MHDCTRFLLSELEAHHGSLLAAVDSVLPERREQRPEPDRWSVAEVLEHLAVIESRIIGLIGIRIEPLPAMPSGWSGPGLPVMDVARLLDRTERIMGPESVQPREGLNWLAALQRLEESRAATHALIESADCRDLSSAVLPHPVLGELNVYEWFALIGLHEERHALQVREAASC